MTSKMPLFSVYLYEGKQLLRSRSFLALTALVLFLGIYAIIYGHSEVNDQRRKISLLKNNVDSLYKAVQADLQMRDTTASVIGERLGRVHVNYPDGMASLSFGQRDIHKFVQQITNGSYFYNKYSTGYVNKTMSNEIVNPFKLLAGHLDISFVLLLLFPLYVVLLCYNVLSGEREGGTLSLLAIQPVSTKAIIFHKLLIRCLVAVILGLILLFIAGSVNDVLYDRRWWLFCGTFTTYIICWMGIIALVISFKKSSGLNALAMASAWLFFTILLPSLLNAVLNNIRPVATKIQLAAAVQKANAEAFTMPKQIKVDSFKTLRPYYGNAFDTIGSWEDPKFYRVTHYLIDYYIRPFEEQRIHNVVKRNHFADQLNYFSPTLIAQSALNELAGSNMQQMLKYDTSAYSYFQKISQFTDDYIFLKNNRFSKSDLVKIPFYEFNYTVNYYKIYWSCLMLLLAGLLLLLITYIRLANITLLN